MEVAPRETAIGVGQTQQFTATAVFADGAAEDVTGRVQWNSDRRVAIVDANGLATGVAPGVAGIGADLDGIGGEAILFVDLPAILTRIEVDPREDGMRVGERRQFRADGDIDVSGVFLGTFVPSGSGGLNGLARLAIGFDGNLYVASFQTDSVLRYSRETGEFIDAFVPAGSGGLDGPTGLAFGHDGHLYVSSFVTNSVLRYDGWSGRFVGEFVRPGSGGLDGPRGPGTRTRR